MFIAQAHSFVQQARLALTLAWVAGYTNILTILTCGTVVSHVSGTTSNLGRDLVEQKWGLAAFAAFLLLTFLVGAAVSGFTTELGRRRNWESIYVLPMAIEAILLSAFCLGVELHGHPLAERDFTLYWMSGVASIAMGLQNATITRISSGVIRTTHVTGVLTDLGTEAVQFLWWLADKRRNTPPGSVRGVVHGLHVHPTTRRLALLLSVVGSFALGASLGTLAFDEAPRLSMLPPVLFLMWAVYQDIARPIAEIEESSLHKPGGGLDLPESIAIFHLRKDKSRRGHAQRLPNLLAWIDHLPARSRVVILDLTEVTHLDDSAPYELRAALSRLTSQGRHLVIAGLTGEQYEQLRRAGAGEMLDPQSVCPDFELAIARGLNLAERLAAVPRVAVPVGG